MTGPRLNMNVRLESWPLKEPVAIAGHKFTALDVVVVTLTDGVLTGRGEAAGVYYRNDVPGLFIEQIESVRGPVEAACTRDDLLELLPCGGARNAVDCALWELEAARAGTPVWALAGIDQPKPMVTSRTLGADSPAEMAMAAKAVEASDLKLKLLGDGEDGERAFAVRKARPDAWLGVDANQGLTPSDLRTLYPIFDHARISMIEQPLPAGKDEFLSGFDRTIPIFADESAQDEGDLAALVGRYDGVNIKLDKCGGLTAALRMAAEARRLGLALMVGNMAGTSLAMAPAFILGQQCDFADLDGPLLLAADRRPHAIYSGRYIECPSAVWGNGYSAAELESA